MFRVMLFVAIPLLMVSCAQANTLKFSNAEGVKESVCEWVKSNAKDGKLKVYSKQDSVFNRYIKECSVANNFVLEMVEKSDSAAYFAIVKGNLGLSSFTEDTYWLVNPDEACAIKSDASAIADLCVVLTCMMTMNMILGIDDKIDKDCPIY